MSNAALASVTTSDWRALRPAGIILLVGLVLLGLIFHAEVAAAIGVWSSSTAYNHCFLVLPIVAWLAWERRATISGALARPAPWTALAALPLGVIWLAAERLGIMEGRQLAVIAFVQLLFLAVLGKQVYRRLAVPLLYLFFLVPFGAFLTPALQNFTTWFIVNGLNLLGIPNFSDGNTIEIPQGTFYVAEACAGLRFLIASLAFSVLYACTMYHSLWRRLAFMGLSVAVPIVANGVRALGIVVAGHWLGSAKAAAADHLIYGWLFFSVVTLLLVLAGLPFRQDVPFRPLPGGNTVLHAYPVSWLLLPAALVLALGFSASWMAVELDRAASVQPAVTALLLPGCVRELDGVNPFGGTIQKTLCANGTVRLLTMVFSPRVNPSLILTAQRLLTGQGGAEEVAVSSLSGADAAPWWLIRTGTPAHVAATLLWIDGHATSGGLRSRLHQAWNSLVGSRWRPVLLVAELAADSTEASPQDPQAIRHFVEDTPNLATQMTDLSSGSLPLPPGYRSGRL